MTQRQPRLPKPQPLHAIHAHPSHIQDLAAQIPDRMMARISVRCSVAHKARLALVEDAEYFCCSGVCENTPYGRACSGGCSLLGNGCYSDGDCCSGNCNYNTDSEPYCDVSYSDGLGGDPGDDLGDEPIATTTSVTTTSTPPADAGLPPIPGAQCQFNGVSCANQDSATYCCSGYCGSTVYGPQCLADPNDPITTTTTDPIPIETTTATSTTATVNGSLPPIPGAQCQGSGVSCVNQDPATYCCSGYCGPTVYGPQCLANPNDPVTTTPTGPPASFTIPNFTPRK